MSKRTYEPDEPDFTRVKHFLLVYGPTNSGKTTAALSLAEGFGNSTCLINTETFGAQFQQGRTFKEVNWPKLFGQPDGTIAYNPDDLIDCLKQVDASGKYDTIIVDNLNLFQEETEGWYEQKDRLDQQSPKTQQMNWKVVNEGQRRLVQTCKNLRAHVIFTAQAAPLNELKGNVAVQIGWKPRVREKVCEEVLLIFELDAAHKFRVAKNKLHGKPMPAGDELTKDYGAKLLAHLGGFTPKDLRGAQNPDEITLHVIGVKPGKDNHWLEGDNEWLAMPNDLARAQLPSMDATGLTVRATCTKQKPYEGKDVYLASKVEVTG